MDMKTEQQTQSPELRHLVADLPPAASVQINDAVYRLKRDGKDIITLSLGEAFFEQPMISISESDFAAGMHYSDSRGVPELREKIATHYEKKFGAQVDPDREILISAGSKAILYMCMLAATNPGGEILIHEPGWLSYLEQARLAGASPRQLQYKASTKDILSEISPRTNMLILNNPNNPAGRLYSRQEISDFYNECLQQNTYLLLDESYSDFAPPGEFASLSSVAPNKSHALVVNSLSKNLGVSGWRIGYLIAEEQFVNAILKLNQHLITCAPTLLSNYCAKNFEAMVANTEPQLTTLQDKRTKIANAIAKRQLSCLTGSTTFYFFLSIEGFPGTDVDFARMLLVDEGVSVVPGSAYGSSTDRFVRISIGTEPTERIETALDSIKQLTIIRSFAKENYTAKFHHLVNGP
tara:strand:- start:5397 stop:6623 length:1227 start_codon:yes stop_codon:yes gene_type:complete